MAHYTIRPAGHQFVIFVQAGVDTELPAQMPHGGPREDGGEDAADGGNRDAP